MRSKSVFRHLSIILMLPVLLAAQSTYHLQRATLFELLPGDTTDIVFLGNSITDGGNWSELFNRLEVKNRGISGDISSGVLARLDPILVHQPDKIFLMIGVNDLAAGIETPDIVANYDSIIQRVKAESPRTRLYLQSVLPVNPDIGEKFKNHTDKNAEVSQLNWHLRRLARVNDLEYIDLWSEFIDVDGRLDSAVTNDGLHLTGPGYLRWRDLILEQVNE